MDNNNIEKWFTYHIFIMIDGNLVIHFFGPWLQNWIHEPSTLNCAYIMLILLQVVFDYYNLVSFMCFVVKNNCLK